MTIFHVLVVASLTKPAAGGYTHLKTLKYTYLSACARTSVPDSFGSKYIWVRVIQMRSIQTRSCEVWVLLIFITRTHSYFQLQWLVIQVTSVLRRPLICHLCLACTACELADIQLTDAGGATVISIRSYQKAPSFLDYGHNCHRKWRLSSIKRGLRRGKHPDGIEIFFTPW